MPPPWRTEDEVRAQVLLERLEVVLPDRLVDAEPRKDDVAAGPDRGAEREPVPQLRLREPMSSP